MRRRYLIVGAVFLAPLSCGVDDETASATSPSASASLAAMADSAITGYIVLFQKGTPGVSAAANELAGRTSGRAKDVWDRLGGFSLVGATTAEAAALARDPRVRLVETDGRMQLSYEQTLPAGGSQGPLWGLDRIDKLGSFQYDGKFMYDNTGAGVHIYIVDSGVRGGHVDFTGRVGNGACFISNSLGCSPTIDAIGHGTAVASLAAGSVHGVAKGATIHSVRITDDAGGTSGVQCSDVVSGLNWIVANASFPAVATVTVNPDVTKGNEGCFSVRDAIDQTVAANILVFKSAGNWNADAFLDRSNRSASSVVVGATNSGDARSANTAWGSTVSLMAPGEFLEVAWNTNNTAVQTMSGTSLAAPLAAGSAAAMLSANPALSAAQLKTALLNGASVVVIGNGSGVANRVLYSRITPPNVISVSIDGPTSVQPGASCQYSAVASGSPGPFSYSWTLNGSPIGSNSSSLFVTNSATFHDIGVVVTATGATPGMTNIGVSISAGAPPCGE